MAIPETSILNRLAQAKDPFDQHDWEKNDGYYVTACRISQDDAPALIDIAARWRDPDWPENDPDLADEEIEVEMLPVTAWRALADLKSAESVDPLIRMLCDLDEDLGDDFDDWTLTELPYVFGKIGKPAVEALIELANDVEKSAYVRSTAAEGLQHVAEYHPDARDQVVALLTDMMANVAESAINFNSNVLAALVELNAADAAEAIERAFANNLLDVGMMGDWESVRQELGVEGLGLPMPKHPHNSIEKLRAQGGVGVFSDRPIFGPEELDHEAEQAYYERARDLFSKSAEGRQVIDRFGSVGWLELFLVFGIQYRGEIVEEMTLDGICQFVLDHVPRKVSAAPADAESIIFELTRFWEFMDRVYELPAAESIINWLTADGIVAGLEADMSNPANFGTAKSLFTQGQAAGYDMTSQEDMNQFIEQYNRSLASTTAIPPEAKTSDRPKVGRNDPCPCGSGKKFKKCCLR